MLSSGRVFGGNVHRAYAHEENGMRKVLGSICVLVFLSAGIAYARSAVLPPFGEWPLKVGGMKTETVRGMTVTNGIDTYYDNADPQNAENIVLDMREESVHAILWYTILEKKDDTMKILVRFFVEKGSIMELRG